eukprot:s3975_g2.t1
MDVHYQDGLLHMDVWDGLGHEHGLQMQLLRKFKRILALPTGCVHLRSCIGQMYPFTCGTVALLHLGVILGLWTASCHPDELDWHLHLLKTGPSQCLLRAGGVGDLSTAEREAVRELQSILQTRGVPEASTEERALMGLSRIGLGKIQEALQSRDAWAALKAAGSAPKINFLWLKPMELEAQIKRRAQSKFRINASSKKHQRSPGAQGQPTVVDPQDLQLISDTFVTNDGEPVSQISISDVGANRTGLAFALLAQAQPFLQGTESLTLGGLAILTTSVIPPEQQGLLPVTNLRFPALFVPTGEPILIEGSLIQLGDQTIQRVQDREAFHLDEIPTTVIKVSVFKDQWPLSWESFGKSPVKELLQHMPLLSVEKLVDVFMPQSTVRLTRWSQMFGRECG